MELTALADDFNLNVQADNKTGVVATVEYILTDWIPDILTDENGLWLMIPESTGSTLPLSALADDFLLNTE